MCFRYVAEGLDRDALDALNGRIVTTLQDSGVAAPSTTVLPGGRAIRVAIVNHRTTRADVERLVDVVVAVAEGRSVPAAGTRAAE